MFKNLFQRSRKAFADRGPITLHLRFLEFAEDQSGANIAWSATGAPDGVYFDVDFLGHPSGITTGFVWDGEYDTLNSVFVSAGDTSFGIKVAWAYGDVAQDGSGKVGAAWAKKDDGKDDSKAELMFRAGSTATIELVFEPAQKLVRTV